MAIPFFDWYLLTVDSITTKSLDQNLFVCSAFEDEWQNQPRKTIHTDFYLNRDWNSSLILVRFGFFFDVKQLNNSPAYKSVNENQMNAQIV